MATPLNLANAGIFNSTFLGGHNFGPDRLFAPKTPEIGKKILFRNRTACKSAGDNVPVVHELAMPETFDAELIEIERIAFSTKPVPVLLEVFGGDSVEYCKCRDFQQYFFFGSHNFGPDRLFALKTPEIGEKILFRNRTACKSAGDNVPVVHELALPKTFVAELTEIERIAFSTKPVPVLLEVFGCDSVES